MTRPASVDALFAGHTLPKSKAALDEVREYIRGLERIKEAARFKGQTCHLVHHRNLCGGCEVCTALRNLDGLLTKEYPCKP